MAQDWVNLGVISNTMGATARRVCVGAADTDRPSDIGCAATAPYVSGSYLGINTATPTVPLEVSGTISATALYINGQAVGAGGGDRITSGTSAVTINSATSTISFTTAGSQRMTIDGSGNVGIGTTAPSYPLTVSGDIYVLGATADQSLRIAKSTGSPDSANIYWGGSGGWKLNFKSNNASKTPILSLTEDGSYPTYGFGTTAPITRYALYTSNTLASKMFQFVNPTTAAATTIATIAATSYGLNSGALSAAEVEFLTGAVGYTGVIAFRTNGTDSTVSRATERMRIDSSGNVGIGTTAPSSTLHIYNSGYGQRITGNGFSNYWSTEANPRMQADQNLLPNSNAGIAFNTGGATTISAGGAAVGLAATRSLGLYTSDGSALTERVRIDSTGNVGIGTTAPSHPIEISASQGTAINVTTPGAYSFIQFNSSGGNGAYFGNYLGDAFFQAPAGKDIQFWAQGGTVLGMVLKNSGNVGIGTTAPAKTLDVSGTARIASATMIGFSGTPSTTLHVSGTAKITGGLRMAAIESADLCDDGSPKGTIRYNPTTKALEMCH
ncbi:MAG: hypothetical protein P9E88_05340 [Candidatus Competibacter sp.]|nr:hypothetical protein [Candidatus Competibacter sp.]